jgi:hypothetical protein
MPKRTSPRDIARIDVAADLDEVVVDKRESWRASDAKAHRRQRRYAQLLTRELVKKPSPSSESGLYGDIDADDAADGRG